MHRAVCDTDKSPDTQATFFMGEWVLSRCCCVEGWFIVTF